MKKKVHQILSVLTATAVMALTLSSCGGEAQQQQAPAPEVEVLTVTPGSATNSVSYPATIKGKTDIAIRPQVSGNITKVLVDEGQHVSKGQLLFTIDPVQFQAAVDQAQAAVNSAKTSVSNAEITESNQRRLYEKNIISQYEWQLSKNALETAKAALAQANAALISARKNLTYCNVTSPSSGVIGTIPFREGSLVSPSSATPLTTVSDNSQVYAYFSLNEKEILDLTHNGNISMTEAIAQMPPVMLQLANGSVYPIEGKVSTVSGVNDLTTGSSSVRALFDNPNGILRSGSTGMVILPQVSNDVIIVPQKATYEIQNLRYVLTVNDSNQTVPTSIEVLNISDGKTFVVTSGLKSGDRIVVEGVNSSVRPGMVIKPKSGNTENARPMNENPEQN